ncbi:NADH-quinone oxidoreductase subunit C, partial [Klebsiella variicola]|uniref:NADH-quinone oxidoreductase subunit C n=1 Tax=Klebsiella variicola TaxID=244366 RepID=UPI00272FD3B1
LDPVKALQEKFADDILHVKRFRNETTVVVAAERIREVMAYLKSTPGLIYNFLSDISAVDYYPNDYGAGYEDRPERYGVAYHIYSMLYNRR